MLAPDDGQIESEASDVRSCCSLLGRRVKVADHVRPQQFARKLGTIVAFNGDEVGVRFGSPRSHTPTVWFRRRELALADVGEKSSEGFCSHQDG